MTSYVHNHATMCLNSMSDEDSRGTVIHVKSRIEFALVGVKVILIDVEPWYLDK